MEYMPLGNLNEIHLQEALSAKEAKLVLFQTLQALAYLHDQKSITHRDIKPQNILVRSRTPELFIKLCDFGLSTEQIRLRTSCGTLCYAAPEIFERGYSNSVDIWALGVVALQYTDGLPPFCEKMKSQKYSALITKRASRLAAIASKPMERLIQRMLDWKPHNRPTARECLLEPFMMSCCPSTTDLTDEKGTCLEPVSEQPTEIYNPCVAEPRVLEEPIRVKATCKRKAIAGPEHEHVDSTPPGPCSSRSLQVHRDREPCLRQPLNALTNARDVGAVPFTLVGPDLSLPQERAGIGGTGRRIVKGSGPDLPQIWIRAGQTGQKNVAKRRRVHHFFLSSNRDIPEVRHPSCVN